MSNRKYINKVTFNFSNFDNLKISNVRKCLDEII